MKKFNGFLKGVNLGGWISQFAEYSEEHFNTYITEADIERIKGMGFDHVRVPVDYNVLQDENENVLEAGYKHIDDCISWCKKYDLNMIIDVHEVYGYSFDPLKSMDREIFFYNENLQARFFRLWETIATRYKDESDRVAFELLNEIVLIGVAKAWNEVARKAIEHIRAIAPNTFILVGGTRYNNVISVPELDAPYDDKVVYNFHCYDPLVFTHQGAYWVNDMPSDFRIGYPLSVDEYRNASNSFQKELMGAIYDDKFTSIGPEFFETLFAPAIEAADKYDAYLYCGEYGVIELADKPSTKRWLADIHTIFDKYGIGRSVWNYKGKDFGIIDSDYGF